MKTFVLLFRQRPPFQLSNGDQERRAEEIRAWAPRQNSEGRKLDPRTLGEEIHRWGPGGTEEPTGASEERMSAILFIEARDFADAVSVAKSHPGLRYGAVSVEVRPWTSPVALPSPRP